MRELTLYTLTGRLDHFQKSKRRWKRIEGFVLAGLAAVSLIGSPALSNAAEERADAGRTTVKRDGVRVYGDRATASKVVTVLPRGTVVTFDFALSGPEGAWCHVTNVGRTKGVGYMLCEDLDRGPSPHWRLYLPGLRAGPEPQEIQAELKKLEAGQEGEISRGSGGQKQEETASGRDNQDWQQRLYRELTDIKEILNRIAQAVER